MGPQGENAVLTALFEILPTVERAYSLPDSVQKLRLLKESGQCKLAPEDAQILVGQAYECVCKVDGGCAPQLLENPIDRLSKIYSSLQYYCRIPSDDGEVVGAAAFQSLFEGVRSATCPEDLEQVVKWSWLATVAQKSELEAKRSEINRQVMESVKKRKADALAAKEAEVLKRRAAKASPAAVVGKAKAGASKRGVKEMLEAAEVESPSATAAPSSG